MTDYSELVKALRHCSRDGIVKCNECKYYGKEWPDGCEEEMMRDAADAIEELQAGVKRLNMRCADCEYASKPWPELEPKRGEWEVKGANRIDCSVCGHSICFASVLSKGSLTGYNYCPNCGADMWKMEVQE